MKPSSIHRNPFAVLGATTRDDRRRLVELANDKSLEADHDECQKARSDLTNPRARLSAEMAWLPGVSPKKASQLAALLLSDPIAIRRASGLPLLAHANLLASVFESVGGRASPSDVAALILEFAFLVEKLSAEVIMREINEDRAASGFPELKDLEQVEAELAERKRLFRNCVKDALNELPPLVLVEAMTLAVQRVTAGGAVHAPQLIDELVDSYALESQLFLQKEGENVAKLLGRARASAGAGEQAVRRIVDKLEPVLRNWDKVAQPIQLSAKARGLEHEQSNELAHAIRELAVELFNRHDMLAQSQRLTALVKDVFAEVPEVSHKAEEDSEALADISRDRDKATKDHAEWVSEITYRAEVGVVFTNTLSISPEGVSWKRQTFPLESVTRIRWGGIRHSVNGIPTGTTFTVAFGDARSEAVVELRNEETFSAFTGRLWRAVGVRLLIELLKALKGGAEIRFGDALLRDDGITLVKHHLFTANEAVRCSWWQVKVWAADGAFYIGHTDDKKTYVALSYIEAPNTHVLEHAIRMAFKKTGVRVLSDLLE